MMKSVFVLLKTTTLYAFVLASYIRQDFDSMGTRMLIFWNLWFPFCSNVWITFELANSMCRRWIYLRLMEYGVLLDFKNRDDHWWQMLHSNLVWYVMVSAITMAIQIIWMADEDLMSPLTNISEAVRTSSLSEAASSAPALFDNVARFSVLVSFVILLLNSIYQIRSFEKHSLISLNRFSEGWSVTDAIDYFAKLERMDEDQIISHVRWRMRRIRIAKKYGLVFGRDVEGLKLSDRFLIDYATIGQRKDESYKNNGESFLFLLANICKSQGKYLQDICNTKEYACFFLVRDMPIANLVRDKEDYQQDRIFFKRIRTTLWGIFMLVGMVHLLGSFIAAMAAEGWLEI